MRTWLAFAAGLVVGGSGIGLVLETANAQADDPGIIGLYHAGVTVPDMQRSLDYYENVLGFREAFRSVDDAGEPRLVYLQMSKNTFLELNRANGKLPAGINHIGVQVADAKAAVAAFRARGAEVEDPRQGSTGSIITNIAAPDGVRIELTELPPSSEPRKAMDRWR